MQNDGKGSFLEVLEISEFGHEASYRVEIESNPANSPVNVIHVYLDVRKQVLQGIGASFTESSAFVLAHLEPTERKAVMKNIFSKEGANFSIARTPIGSCDFSVEGHYSYADKEDKRLKGFSLCPDKDGFKSSSYPNVKDETYDLLPMIKEAQAIKSLQQDDELKIIASAWTAPPWMKDNQSWHEPGSQENNFNGYGGVLREDCESVYADYLVKYLEAYRSEGIDIWGLTPVNEPGGNNGNWESMHFTASTQNAFIKYHLGPKLQESGNKEVNLMIFDHNSGALEEWADAIIGDSETKQFVYGSAVHWYESTNRVFEDVFDKVHEKYPNFPIIHSEGCIDDLGNDAGPGIEDPDRYKETGWFKNDSFWWNKNATDWAYSATWKGVVVEDHPIYAPVHRYAKHIITGMNHWVSAWVDWNIVLDQRGGPNHVGNYCGAPIMIDTEKSEIYYTPVFSVLAQFSKTIRPGDVVVKTSLSVDPKLDDVLIGSASVGSDGRLNVQVFNSGLQPVEYTVEVGEQYADVNIPANALQTLVIQLADQ